MKSSRILLPALILFSLSATAAVPIPNQMNESARKETLRILGLGTATKLLSNQWGITTHTDGLEFSISYESVPIDDLKRLYVQPSPDSSKDENFVFSRLTVGKGLYNNMDVFLHFSPFSKPDGFTEFGGLLRWGFY